MAGSGNSANNRRQLARTCKKFGLLVQPKALRVLLQEMEERGGNDSDRFLALLEAFRTKLATTTTPRRAKLVTPQLIDLVLEEEEESQQNQLTISPTTKPKIRRKIVIQDESYDESKSDRRDRYPPTVEDESGNARALHKSRQQHASSSRSIRNSNSNKTNRHNKPWKIVSAFDMPKLVYDSMGRQFRYQDEGNYSMKTNSPRALMGTADDLMNARIQRYELVKQKVDRYQEQRRLSRPTTIDRLLGTSTVRSSDNTSAAATTLLGMLRGNPSLGCLELEDPTGCVPLKIDLLSSSSLPTKVDTRGMYLEGTMVLVSGYHEEANSSYDSESNDANDEEHHDDSFPSGTVFRCTSIELPPLEFREETRSCLPPKPSSHRGESLRNQQSCLVALEDEANAASADQETTEGGRRRGLTMGLRAPVPIYSLSNLSLDEEACLGRVGDVLDRMVRETKGAVLVLFGNFCTETSTTATALDELAGLLRTKEVPPNHSVLLVPGPRDVGSNACWPLPAWNKKNVPSSLHPFLAFGTGRDDGSYSTSNHTTFNKQSKGNKKNNPGNLYLCTNPCRLEFADGREVVLFRKDLVRESLSHQLLADADAVALESADANPGGDGDAAVTCTGRRLQRGLPPLASRIFHHAMSQSHLSPSSSSQQAASTFCSPIYWNYDHSMALCPLPDLMVLGLDAEYLEDGAYYGRAGCRVVAPISNPSKNEWQCSIVTLGRRKDSISVEFNDEDDDDDEYMEERDNDGDEPMMGRR